MTREKAIKKIKSYLIDYLPIEDYEEAEEVIEALEQRPCNDAISKSDVFEVLGNLMSIPYDFDRPINEKDVSESMDEIRALPPVTPERPKGHWINIDKTHSKCDKCESVFEIASANGEANYCPNCGSFMK